MRRNIAIAIALIAASGALLYFLHIDREEEIVETEPVSPVAKPRHLTDVFSKAKQQANHP